MRPFLLLALISCFVPSAFAETRTWTQAESGRKIEAEFVGLKDEGTVTIRMAGGRTFDVPLASLSPEDNAFVKAQMSGGEEKKEGATTEGAAEGEMALPEGEVTVTLTGVHMCCSDCEKAAEGILGYKKVYIDPETEIDVSRSKGIIELTAPSGEAMVKVLQAVISSGFYGESDHPVLKIPEPKNPGITTPIMTVRDMHLCCSGCIEALDAAMETVEGFTEHTAEPGTGRFLVKGENLDPYKVMLALRAQGLGGFMQ